MADAVSGKVPELKIVAKPAGGTEAVTPEVQVTPEKTNENFFMEYFNGVSANSDTDISNDVDLSAYQESLATAYGEYESVTVEYGDYALAYEDVDNDGVKDFNVYAVEDTSYEDEMEALEAAAAEQEAEEVAEEQQAEEVAEEQQAEEAAATEETAEAEAVADEKNTDELKADAQEAVDEAQEPAPLTDEQKEDIDDLVETNPHYAELTKNCETYEEKMAAIQEEFKKVIDGLFGEGYSDKPGFVMPDVDDPMWNRVKYSEDAEGNTIYELNINPQDDKDAGFDTAWGFSKKFFPNSPYSETHLPTGKESEFYWKAGGNTYTNAKSVEETGSAQEASGTETEAAPNAEGEEGAGETEAPEGAEEAQQPQETGKSGEPGEVTVEGGDVTIGGVNGKTIDFQDGAEVTTDANGNPVYSGMTSDGTYVEVSTDANGNTVETTYDPSQLDENGKPKEGANKSSESVYNPNDGTKTETKFDEDGNKASESKYDNKGNKTSETTFDEKGNIAGRTLYNEAGQETVSEKYGEDGKLTSITIGGQTYEGDNLVFNEETQQYDIYGEDGQYAGSLNKDENGYQITEGSTTKTFNENGEMTNLKVGDVEVDLTDYELQPDGSYLYTDPKTGDVSIVSFDSEGNLVLATGNEDNGTAKVYDSEGNLTKVIVNDSEYNVQGKDANGDYIVSNTAQGIQTISLQDDGSVVVKNSSKTGESETSQTYDSTGRLTSVEINGQKTEIPADAEVDENGNYIIVAENGLKTTVAVGQDGSISITSENKNGSINQTVTDANGNVLYKIENGKITEGQDYCDEHGITADGAPAEITIKDGDITIGGANGETIDFKDGAEVTEDENGNKIYSGITADGNYVEVTTDADGYTVVKEYDPSQLDENGKPKEGAEPNVTSEYSPYNGTKKETVIDGDGNKTVTNFDKHGDKNSEESYDKDDNLVAKTLYGENGEPTVSEKYGEDGKLTSITIGGATFEGENLGYNEQTGKYEIYDADGNVVAILDKNDNGYSLTSDDGQFGESYGPDGNLVSVTHNGKTYDLAGFEKQEDGSYVKDGEKYTFNADGSVSHTSVSEDGKTSRTDTYDENGELAKVTINGVDYTPKNHRDGDVEVTVDADGNVTVTNSDNGNVKTSSTYGPDGKLISTTINGQTIEIPEDAVVNENGDYEFTDAEGNKTTISVGDDGSITSTVENPNGSVDQVVTDANGNIVSVTKNGKEYEVRYNSKTNQYEIPVKNPDGTITYQAVDLAELLPKKKEEPAEEETTTTEGQE